MDEKTIDGDMRSHFAVTETCVAGLVELRARWKWSDCDEWWIVRQMIFDMRRKGWRGTGLPGEIDMELERIHAYWCPLDIGI